MSRKPLLEDVLRSVDDVDGWMSPDQAEALYDAATACAEGEQIVEIGSFRGRSTIVLASAAPQGVTVVAIDPHAGNDRGPQEIDGFGEEAQEDHTVFLANLAHAGVAERVHHVRATSADAHDDVAGEVAMLYIDGAHRYGPARDDIDQWGARVRDGSTMLIHDSFSSIGVTLAIVRELMFGRRFRYVGRRRSLTIYRADLPSGVRPRVRNAGRQAAQLPWFVRNVLLKIALTLGLGRAWKLAGKQVPEWPY